MIDEVRRLCRCLRGPERLAAPEAPEIRASTMMMQQREASEREWTTYSKLFSPGACIIRFGWACVIPTPPFRPFTVCAIAVPPMLRALCPLLVSGTHTAPLHLAVEWNSIQSPSPGDRAPGLACACHRVLPLSRSAQGRMHAPLGHLLSRCPPSADTEHSVRRFVLD